MPFNNDHNDDYLKSPSLLPTGSKAKSSFNYFTDSYSDSVLQRSFIKFNENNLKIQKLEEHGKDTTKLYSENRLILASIKYFQTKLPCKAHDKVISCLNHIGVNRASVSFNYFNDCARVLEGQEGRLLEEDGVRLLEGVCATTGENFKCSYTFNDTTYYRDSAGNIQPVSAYHINTDIYDGTVQR